MTFFSLGCPYFLLCVTSAGCGEWRGLTVSVEDCHSKGRGFASPSRHQFFREEDGPKKKSREKSSRIVSTSRIVNERERADVCIRWTSCEVDSEGGMRVRSGYEKWFGSN